MVKLRYCAKCVKLLFLAVLLIFIWGAIWMQSSVHSLAFAKPWILSSLNPADAPYSVSFNEVSIDWRRITQFGRLHITDVTLAKREGGVFARLPEIDATIDPFGFLPRRTILSKIILREPHLYVTRNVDGDYKFGFEDAEASLSLSELVAPAPASDTPPKPIRLPFRNFTLDNASVNFYDEKSESRIVTKALQLTINRRYGRYHGTLEMPFTYDQKEGSITAKLTPISGRKDYRLDAALVNIPAPMICDLGNCNEKLEAEGTLNANLRLGAASNGVIGAAWAQVSTKRAVVNVPGFFEKPLKLGESEIIASYDAEKNSIILNDSKVTLEDAVISAKAVADKREDGWHIEGTGQTNTPLDVAKLYKYWPIALSKDSRAWVTSKIKAGNAMGKATVHVTPADIEKGELSDASLSADVDTRDTSFEYLPGFPLIEHMNGQAHFTGTTVKVISTGATTMAASKITKAVLWCPELLNPHNPMEVELTIDMPMTEVAQLLEQKSFTFDDQLGLNPKTIKGQLMSTMTLKFNAFSEEKESDPSVIHLDAIDYDLKANIINLAQDGIYGSYDVKSLTGELKANAKSTSFNGVATVGEVAPAQVDVTSSEGKPTIVTVKPAPVTGPQQAKAAPGSDFTLTYQKTDRMNVTLEGKRLDASASLGKSKNPGTTLLRDFPAIKLLLNLEELVLMPGLPFTNVKGTLECGTRCESAHFTAMQGKSAVNGDINRVNGQRQLVVTANDAGGFLKALDATDRMTGGKLELRGTYDDSRPISVYNGKFTVYNFTLKNAEVLGRILSIGSFTGLANALTGSGISFDKMLATITSRNGIVTIADGRANGNAMGITTAGTVDTVTAKLALKGVVVPAYALNSMLAKIPIIGALSGGEGEGLIAFNYSVGGTMENPDVGVNPLSGLTPGFLRGIFGVFDQKATDAEKAANTTKFAPPSGGTNSPVPIQKRSIQR